RSGPVKPVAWNSVRKVGRTGTYAGGLGSWHSIRKAAVGLIMVSFRACLCRCPWNAARGPGGSGRWREPSGAAAAFTIPSLGARPLPFRTGPLRKGWGRAPRLGMVNAAAAPDGSRHLPEPPGPRAAFQGQRQRHARNETMISPTAAFLMLCQDPKPPAYVP